MRTLRESVTQPIYLGRDCEIAITDEKSMAARVVLSLLLIHSVHSFSPSLHASKARLVPHASHPDHAARLPPISRHHLVAANVAPAAEPASPGGLPLTMAIIALWYAASVVCNQTTKVLTASLGAQCLTLAQLVVSTGCGALVLGTLRAFCSECVFQPVMIQSRAQLVDTSVLAAAFTAGFVTLNACMGRMHVSLVMVLRAAEPLTTLALGTAFFGASVPLKKALVLLLIVVGGALSAAGPFKATAAGLAIATLSNVCFSLRGLLGKRLSRRHGTGALESFFQLCAIGALLQAALLVIIGGGLGAFAPLRATLLGAGGATAARLAIINGAAFYAYLQLSWVCLGRMSAVSHSVANSLRRPVTVIAALAYDPAHLTPTNLVGIVLACAAAAVYGLM